MADRRRRSQRSIPPTVIVLGVLVAGCAITYGIVLASGWLDPKAPLASKPSREGKVRVPKSLVQLKAYEVVRREDIYNLNLGEDSYFWLNEDQLERNPHWITDVDKIVGRVMARDKRADFTFSEKDFLPEGSRSGIAGGIPVGKQGFFLEADQVPGLRFLKSGDRFDLLASAPEEAEDGASEYGLLLGGIKASGGKPIPLSGVRILAQNAQMIALTTTRSMTTQGGLELNAADSRGRAQVGTKEERVAIAIDPAEAVPLTQALGTRQKIQMVTKSGQESASAETADLLKGRIGIPASSVPIAAFRAITARDLSEPTNGELRQYFFTPDKVQDAWLVRPEQLIGRVLGRDVEAGYIFTEEDFLPIGSVTEDIAAYNAIPAEALVGGASSKWYGRIAKSDIEAGTEITESMLLPVGAKPGFASAIPAGKMAIAIDKESLQGAAELRRGDRCDVLTSVAFDTNQFSGIRLSPSIMGDLVSKASNNVLATDAVVIQQGDSQIVIAVTASQVSSVAKAIALKQLIFCVARQFNDVGSAVNDEPSPTQLVSDPDPLSDIVITETLINGQREVRAFRRSQ